MAEKQPTKPIPAHGVEHVERGERIRKQVYGRMESRIAEHHKERPVNPSANTLPALSNRPSGSLPKPLKKGG